MCRTGGHSDRFRCQSRVSEFLVGRWRQPQRHIRREGYQSRRITCDATARHAVPRRSNLAALRCTPVLLKQKAFMTNTTKQELFIRYAPDVEHAIAAALWQLEDGRAATLNVIKDVSPAALDWEAEHYLNSIGTLLYHIALVEAD